MYSTLYSSFEVLPYAILICGICAVIMSRATTLRIPPAPWWLDPIVLALLAAFGIGYAGYLHNLANPTWLPFGEDWWDFTTRALELQRIENGESFRCSAGNRYPLYAWLGLRLAEIQNTAIYIGCMKVSIIAAGLMPVALYILGR